MKRYGIGILMVLIACSASAIAWSQMTDGPLDGDRDQRRRGHSPRYDAPRNCGGSPESPDRPPLCGDRRHDDSPGRILDNSSVNHDPGERDRGRPPHPLLELFDANQDGEISKEEIVAATPMLKKMDANEDGKLTNDELSKPPRHVAPSPRNERGDTSPNTTDNEIDMSPQPKGNVVIDQGHQTDPRDGGRPVKLIAAALGVEDEVFRQAFSNVQPARGGHPTAQRARANKEVLMSALEPHGVTNDRLDEVSNWYRYRPESGELWRHREATITPVIEDGKLVSVHVDEGGAGYISTPRIRITGFEDVRLNCELAFDEDLERNGRIVSITIDPATDI